MFGSRMLRTNKRIGWRCSAQLAARIRALVQKCKSPVKDCSLHNKKIAKYMFIGVLNLYVELFPLCSIHILEHILNRPFTHKAEVDL
jgi:hypothetical protein